MKSAEFSSSFLKILNKLEVNRKELIKIKIKQILLDSTIGIPLKGNLKVLWELRVGKFRILYKFDNKKVYFIVLNLRKKIYRKKF